ncbi:P52 family lipoprotein [Borreliella garinii]|uniref:P52 family lipoprotein n=1 Tax=Borreliella garinii TaxID=29519 RepID=UPI003F7B611B
MKKIINKLNKNDLNHLPPLFENHNEKILIIFLGFNSKRSKELLNLFLKIKTIVNNNSFEIKGFLLYLCIENLCLVNLLFFDKDSHICSNDGKHNYFDDPFPLLINGLKK